MPAAPTFGDGTCPSCIRVARGARYPGFGKRAAPAANLNHSMFLHHSMFLLDASTQPSTNTWILVALAAITIIYVAFVRPMVKTKKDPLEKKPGQASLAQQRSVERQMQSLLVELSEMSRQISGQLDTRAAKLEILIKEADEKIAAMKPAGAAAPPPATAEFAIPPETPSIKPTEPLDPRHAMVYALADQGRTAHEIANEIGRPSGEVELILALRQRT